MQRWYLKDARLHGEFSHDTRKKQLSHHASKPSKQEYNIGEARFPFCNNSLDSIEHSMNLLFRSEWLPLLPKNGEQIFKEKLPLLGCYIYGNMYIQLYDGVYRIKPLEVELFKGQKCQKFGYNISGPFATYFKEKGTLEKSEATALMKLQQGLVISGLMHIDMDTGIIHRRSEFVDFQVTEHHRINFQSEWVQTKTHVDISRERTWTIESVQTTYKP